MKTNKKTCNDEFYPQNQSLKSKRLFLIKRFNSWRKLSKSTKRKINKTSRNFKNKSRNF